LLFFKDRCIAGKLTAFKCTTTRKKHTTKVLTLTVLILLALYSQLNWYCEQKLFLNIIHCFVQDIMLTLKLNAKSSTFATLMTKVPFRQFHSYAPMEPSSTRTISSVIGGSTLNAQKLKTFTL
jgi:hypothetical protein